MGKKQNTQEKNNKPPVIEADAEKEEISSFFTLDKCKKASAYIGLFLLVFSGGFTSGVYKSEVSHKIEVLEINRQFEKETEVLKKQIQEYEMLNLNYATKEELEELKKNMEKFYNSTSYEQTK